MDYIPSSTASDETNTVQAPPEPVDLANLRENILKITSEYQLSKTILIYVDALESTAAGLAFQERRVKKRSHDVFEQDMEAGTVRIHLKRSEGRLIEREAAL